MSKLARGSFLTAAFLLAAGCFAPADSDNDASEAPEELGVVVESIIGGVEAPDYPEAALVNMRSAKGGNFACTGAVIAPRVVLTAGHCVDGYTDWTVTAAKTTVTSKSAEVYDWKGIGSTTVSPNHHDIGLIYLPTPITLASYPTLASAPLANGSKVTNVGRIRNATVTNTIYKASSSVTRGTPTNFPYAYFAPSVIEKGDSGGPVYALGTRTLVAVNSGSNGTTAVLARADLLKTWIDGRVAANSGSADAGTARSDAGAPADARAPQPPAPPPDAGAPADAGASREAGAPPTGAGACVQEREPNNTAAQASPLGSRTCGALATATDQDFYSITISRGTKTILAKDQRFSLGQIQGNNCAIVMRDQSTVKATVANGSANICIVVSGKTAGAYTLEVL